jgi:hypothetical protein
MSDQLEKSTQLQDEVRAVLREARSEYQKSWEWLKNPAHPRAERSSGRAKVAKLVDYHEAYVQQAREMAASLSGEDRRTVQELASQIERITAAWPRLATLSPHGISTAEDLSPKAVGCGPVRKPRSFDDRKRSNTSVPRIGQSRLAPRSRQGNSGGKNGPPR